MPTMRPWKRAPSLPFDTSELHLGSPALSSSSLRPCSLSPGTVLKKILEDNRGLVGYWHSGCSEWSLKVQTPERKRNLGGWKNVVDQDGRNHSGLRECCVQQPRGSQAAFWEKSIPFPLWCPLQQGSHFLHPVFKIWPGDHCTSQGPLQSTCEVNTVYIHAMPFSAPFILILFWVHSAGFQIEGRNRYSFY